jgi:hypothetical protein
MSFTQASQPTRPRHLRLVDENYRSPFVEAVFEYDRTSREFIVTLTQNEEVLDIRIGKIHAKRDLTLWFESIEGQKPRIPWSTIEERGEWRATVLMREIFFEVVGAFN